MKHSSRCFVPLLASVALSWAVPAEAASHRSAPIVALDPAVNNTDVYAFVSYDAANLARTENNRRVTFISNYIPGQDPSDGPNYFNFDPTVRYRINIDNKQDGIAKDVVYEFFFTTENRPVGGAGGLTSPVPYLGNPHIPTTVPLQGITALDGPGSEGLTRRQTYRVFQVRNGVRTELFTGRTLVSVPSNIGPATFPDYPALAAQGVYTDATTGVRVFAGQRAETFYIDLGAVFDTLNLRRYLPTLTGPKEDTDFVNPFGVNRFSGSNINTIAIEVPITSVTSDGRPASTTANPVIGVYAAADRREVRQLSDNAPPQLSGDWIQVSRMANPLVNELIITTPFKDGWNRAEPQNEVNFQSFYKNPVIATELNLVFGVPILPINGSPASNRTDLMSIFLKYPGQNLAGSNCGTPCAELLRLDLRVPPTAPESQSRLGSAIASATGATDPAGYPNGRRPNDGVTDITIRVVGGKDYIANHVGNGVNFLEGAPGVVGVDITKNGIAKNFPFLPTPYNGKIFRHIDCGEAGANPCGPLVP